METAFSVFTVIVVWFMGCSIGSFFGVIIDRVPRGEGFVTGRSHCNNCGRQLGILELIPSLGYFLVRGKCKECGYKLSIKIIIPEIIMGTLAVLLYSFAESSLTIRRVVFCSLIYIFVSVFYVCISLMTKSNK